MYNPWGPGQLVPPPGAFGGPGFVPFGAPMGPPMPRPVPMYYGPVPIGNPMFQGGMGFPNQYIPNAQQNPLGGLIGAFGRLFENNDDDDDNDNDDSDRRRRRRARGSSHPPSTESYRHPSVSPSVHGRRVITDPDGQRFEVIAVLGSGSFGTVYKCRADDGSDVAVKEIDIRSHDDGMAESIISEMKHENIVEGFGGFILQEGRRRTGYIVLEYCENSTLSKWSQGAGRSDKVRAACKLLNGLSFLHKSRHMHRDLKPANILVSADDTVKIGNLGLATAIERSSSSVSRAMRRTWCGTKFYMAPEVHTGQGYSYPADVFSAGVVLLEMFTGTSPIAMGVTVGQALARGHSEATVLAQCGVESLASLRIRDAIVGMLRKEPSNRSTARQAYANFLRLV
ncbi:kinase-like protein [Gonapodya prolifera JEL478]|uniref:Kinase-like protein n=1 Tax=Gonapodya prolifera (strain JEL478) TaxID=1344416 RepID=A0A139APW1_GONPJ|nr:kinase-like protein [Gonapodya prolifera JEL478]|eukprot:KXS18776.1 kinase-like protein [Gonapodya prolifera JEL478]